ncbi:hypothetical protein [Streptomyces sp. NBC_01373]|uniref:hypothetical protein n=1 Tax=Streptomyces sp. NBC_01373 TaxID=2903843 RepID=UPI002253924B|nr:hypothetical protein [Streptomyces sp. NBC_01373]MCX4697277.1 hypothetical protein [Streptomyces sp. NBC_01373]
MPAMFVTALGLGMGFVPMTLVAVSGVDHQDTGLATEDFPLVAKAGEALTHGYTMAFVAAAVTFLAGLAVMFLAVNAGRQQPTEGAPPVHLG